MHKKLIKFSIFSQFPILLVFKIKCHVTTQELKEVRDLAKYEIRAHQT